MHHGCPLRWAVVSAHFPNALGRHPNGGQTAAKRRWAVASPVVVALEGSTLVDPASTVQVQAWLAQVRQCCEVMERDSAGLISAMALISPLAPRSLPLDAILAAERVTQEYGLSAVASLTHGQLRMNLVRIERPSIHGR